MGRLGAAMIEGGRGGWIINIRAALCLAKGKVFGAGGAAEMLGIKPTTLASWIKALGLPRQPGDA
jgi:hypothetical protein